MQVAVSPVGNDDGQPFIEQGQCAAVPFPHAKAEILAKSLHRLLDHAQAGPARFLYQTQRYHAGIK
jgi:hypothetical protein